MATGRVEITDVEAASSWHSPSPRLRTMRRLEVAFGALGLAVVGAVACEVELGLPAAAGVIGGVLVLALLAEGFIDRRYRSWGYLEREDDLFIRRGVLIKRLSIVPYGRMQFVDVTAGIIERMFGIATVRLHTAAAATDARLPGLTVSEAARLRERLTSLGEARAAGI
ncbi:MAG: PH domain-containing protein [Acidimicrobiales bacterium]